MSSNDTPADDIINAATIAGVDDPGLADMWTRLWTPHRMPYLRGENRPTATNDVECPFCRVPRESDEQGLIIARGEYVFAVLNLYPYTSGHLLICPYRHIPDYTDLSSAEVEEFSAFTATAMRALRLASNPPGFNIGMNQGSAAGAGIAAHLHQHVVPRWNGDANFMPIIGRTKTMPALLETTRELLVAAWQRVSTEH